MEIDNKNKAGTIKLVNMLIPLLVVIAVALIYLTTEIKGISYALIGASFLLGYIVFINQLKPNFISVFIGPDLIRFRFKSLSPFNSSNQTIQLKPLQFNRYEINEAFFGLKKKLVLFINSPSGLAKYPPISISALKQNEIEKITKALELIQAMNKVNQNQQID